MVEIKQETYAQVRGEIVPLLQKHWEEIADYKDSIKLEPDWKRYEKMSKTDALFILTARRDGVLVGYSVFFLYTHPHYASCIMGTNDVLFLLPEERAGGVGIRLIKESENQLRERGVKRITWHIKPKNDFSALLSRLGYACEEYVMGKLLES